MSPASFRGFALGNRAHALYTRPAGICQIVIAVLFAADLTGTTNADMMRHKR